MSLSSLVPPLYKGDQEEGELFGSVMGEEDHSNELFGLETVNQDYSTYEARFTSLVY